MDISSIFHAVLDAKSDPAAVSAADLKAGDRLTGRVLRLDSDGQVLMDLGRFRAKAQIGFAVRTGQILNLKVVQNGTPLHLQVDVRAPAQTGMDVPRLDFSQVLTPPDQGRLIRLLDHLSQLPGSNWSSGPASERIIAAMTMIKTLFEPIPADRPPAELGRWLQEALENSGVLFEKKMVDIMMTGSRSSQKAHHPNPNQVRTLIAKDMKPQLVLLKSFFGMEGEVQKLPERMGVDDVVFLRQSVTQLLDHLVGQQDRAAGHIREGDAFQIFSHVLPFKDQEQPVQFKVYYPKKKGRSEGDSHHHIALLLEMTRLGSVRVDLSMARRRLNIRIFVGTEDIRQRLEKHTQALAETLSGLFHEVELVTQVSKEKIKQFEQTGQVESPLGRIDIKV